MNLAADAGATKTAIALVDPSGSVVRDATFATRDFASLEALVEAFLPAGEPSPERACFAVAGPVHGTTAHLTNLDWALDAGRLSEKLGGGEVRLVNDAVALGYAVPGLASDDVVELHAGEPEPDGTIAIAAPGTGLGMAALLPGAKQISGAALGRGLSSEAGNAAFAPVDDLQGELVRWLRERYGFVSRESVCSGRAIPDLYRFLGETTGLRDSLEPADDRTAAILESGMAGRSELSAATVALFVSILGGVVGDWALETAATGGIYLGGGLPPRLLGPLSEPAFLAAIHARGRFSRYVERIPVRVIVDPRAALRGAMALAAQ
ncbi:MAG: glucokinase [Planctomycetota bacterium]